MLSCQTTKWMSWEQLLGAQGLGAPGDPAAAPPRSPHPGDLVCIVCSHQPFQEASLFP